MLYQLLCYNTHEASHRKREISLMENLRAPNHVSLEYLFLAHNAICNHVQHFIHGPDVGNVMAI
jgi:hypothetical protein